MRICYCGRSRYCVILFCVQFQSFWSLWPLPLLFRHAHWYSPQLIFALRKSSFHSCPYLSGVCLSLSRLLQFGQPFFLALPAPSSPSPLHTFCLRSYKCPFSSTAENVPLRLGHFPSPPLHCERIVFCVTPQEKRTEKHPAVSCSTLGELYEHPTWKSSWEKEKKKTSKNVTDTSSNLTAVDAVLDLLIILYRTVCKIKIFSRIYFCSRSFLSK